MDAFPFYNIIYFFTILFGVFGAALIIYGGLRAIVSVILFEMKKLQKEYYQIRRDFTSKLVFGLEFFIAADVLKTLVTPTRDEILLLGAVVIIRTILGYFLSKESKDLAPE
jgi:uncharacterized membrane protein